MAQPNTKKLTNNSINTRNRFGINTQVYLLAEVSTILDRVSSLTGALENPLAQLEGLGGIGLPARQ